MTIEKLDTRKLFADLDKTTTSFILLLDVANENMLDIIPFENSWTVAQVASHVTKSNKAIAQGLQMQGQPAERNADENVEKLKKFFLDYKAKYQSPEFILPTQKKYSKKEVITKLQDSVNMLKSLRDKTDLSEMITLPGLGEITKFEMLNFVVFHTKRHTRQLKNIMQHF